MLFVLNCVWLIIRIDNHSFSNVEQLTFENHEHFTAEVVFTKQFPTVKPDT